MPPLKPRPATTGSVDVLPLQPRLLPSFYDSSRETRSEPRETPPTLKTFLPEYSPTTIVETELGLASASAIAIGSSTEVLVSILENQAGFRRNSFLSVNSQSPISLRQRGSPVPNLGSAIGEAELDDVEENVDQDCGDDLKSPDCDFVRSPSTELTNPSVPSTPSDLPKNMSCDSLDVQNVPNTSTFCDKNLNTNQSFDQDTLHGTYI